VGICLVIGVRSVFGGGLRFRGMRRRGMGVRRGVVGVVSGL